MYTTTILVIGVYFCISYFIKKYFNYWKDRGFPYIEPESLVGHLPGFFYMKQYLGNAYEDAYKKYSGYKLGGIFHMMKPMLLVRDPEEIKQILVKDFESFSCRDVQLDTDREIIGYNLFFNQDQDSWKYIRGNLSKVFSAVKMRRALDDLDRCGEKLHKLLFENRGASVDVKELVSDFTSEVAFSTFFGLDADLLGASTDESRGIRQLGDLFIKPRLTTCLHGLLSCLSSRLPLLCKVRILPRLASDFFLEMVDDLEEYRNKNGWHKPDLFQELMLLLKNSRNTDEQKFMSSQMSVNRKSVAAQCQVFYAAGFETSSFTISSCLHALAHHPEVQSLVHRELDTVLRDNSGVISYDSLKEMKYLDMVISETLRLFPAVPELMRKCNRAYTTTEGLVVEEGTRVVIPITAIHKDPKYYPEPEEFRPERFTKEEIKGRHKYTYLPFGEGPRSCIGMRLGLLQVKYCLASVLSRYQVHPDSRSPYPPKYSAAIFVSTYNEDGFWMRFEPRESAVAA